jgi:drug/metabolite transporter (DMT)-like permease
MLKSVSLSQPSRGLPSVALGASLLGFAAVFVKWGLLGGASPLTIGLYRMLFALPGICWLLRRNQGLGWGKGAVWGLVAGGAFATDLGFWHESMKATSAANSTFIVCGLAPLWVALFSVAVYRTRYRWTGWLGQILGVSGALILALARGARVGSGRGEALAVAASFCYATFSLTISRSRRRLSARQSLLWMSVGSLLCFILVEVFERHPLHGYTPLAWAGLIGLGLVVQLLAWLLINNGLGDVPIALGALALGLQQVATPFLAAWLLNEPLRPLGLLGGAIIVAGIYLVATGEQATVVR